MAVTNIPNVTNWSVTPQNGQVGYFTLMNTWLSESTAVIASLQKAINAQNTANSEINDLAIQVAGNAIDARNARDEALTAVATLQEGAIDDTTIANNKAYSNQKTNDLLGQKVDKNISSYAEKTTPLDADLIPLSDSVASFGIKKLSWANIKATLKTYFDTLYTVASSETVSGIIELATTAEAQTGTDDLRAITPLKLRNALNASGAAPIYACRAWVNFNGTGTVAIRASGNVSSITDNGTGDYTVNFATAMTNTNYSVSGAASRDTLYDGNIQQAIYIINNASFKAVHQANDMSKRDPLFAMFSAF